MVAGEVGLTASAAVFRHPLYTTAKANLTALFSTGLGCPAVRWPTTCWPSLTQCRHVYRFRQAPDHGPLGISPVGFKPEGVARTPSPTRWSQTWLVNSDASPNKPNAAITDLRGHRRREIRSGSTGRTRRRCSDFTRTYPVMGSYGRTTLAATATSAWYQLPPRSPTGCWWYPAAGAIWSWLGEDGDLLRPVPGVTGPDGRIQPSAVFPDRHDGKLRVAQSAASAGLGAAGEDVARIVACDPT